MNPMDDGKIRARIMLIGVVFGLCFAGIAARAVYVQAFKDDWLSEQALHEYQRSLQAEGKRGTIYDSRMNELAVSIDVSSIAAFPRRIQDPRAVARELAPVLDMSRAELAERLSDRSRSFVWIKRQVSPKEADAVRRMAIDGIDFIPEHRRYYPNRTLAAQVLGFTGIDGQGLAGIEFRYNNLLKGGETTIDEKIDARGQRFDTSDLNPGAVSGSSLVLTINRNIQYTAEKELVRTVAETRAKSAMAVVLDPHTGAVLAMANVPLFNPNAYEEYNPNLWRNRTVTDRFEPGSTMKIFSASAAIESGGFTPASTFYCEEGAYAIGKNIIHDDHPYGWLTLRQIIKYSSNIGAVKMGQQIGPEALDATLTRFGFGQDTGIDFPGETEGRLRTYQHWSKIDAGAIAFGHGISVTAIQLAAAAAAVANNGLLMRPYLVSAVLDDHGRTIQTFAPCRVRQVVSPETARTVADMMEAVVQKGGTGTMAAIPGYIICGKTGTARKVDKSGTYSDTRHIASFVGFFPAGNPAAVILVVVNEPKTSAYGGLVAAPAFRNIALTVIDVLGIPPSTGNLNRMVVFSDREAHG